MDEHFLPTEEAREMERYYQESEDAEIQQAALDGKQAGDLADRWENPQWADCEEFSFQGEAQAFFVAAGGPAEDPFILDEDKDGVACELLPRSYKDGLATEEVVATERARQR